MVEIIDIVDDNNNILGKAPREEVHEKKLIHKGVHIFIFNSDGKLLLQKRSMKKKHYPGRWGDIAGHIPSGQTYGEAAERELEEEIGIKTELQYLFSVKKRDETVGDNENLNLYIGYHDGPFNTDKEEVDEVRFFSLEKIIEMIENTPEVFASGAFMFLTEYLKRKGMLK